MRRAAVVSALMFALTAPARSAGEDEPRAFELAVRAGRAGDPPPRLRVLRGDAVRIRVTSDAPGQVHLHAYRLESAARPDAPAELAFTAHATGRFRLEWHGEGAKAASGGHHGPPLATLDVMPK